MFMKDAFDEGIYSGLKLKTQKKEQNKKELFIEELTNEIRNKYPYSLKVEHIIELTGYSQGTVYRMLDCGEIPGAKKIRGWRMPRDVFLSWWLSVGIGEDEIV